jgi:hypothetical protein
MHHGGGEANADHDDNVNHGAEEHRSASHHSNDHNPVLGRG